MPPESADDSPTAELDVPLLFPLLFDQLADSVFVTDCDGVILYVNSAFEQTTGYSGEEAIGQTPRLLKSGVHPREVYEELWRTIQGGAPFRFIFGNRKKNGEVYEEGMMISPIRGADGRTTHYLAMGRVINAFRQNYDVFTVLANTSPAAIYLQRDAKLFFVNEQLSRQLGFSADQLLGREWLELVAEEDRAAVQRQMNAILDGAQDTPFEHRVVTADGETRWLMGTVRRVEFRGIQAVAGDFVAGYLLDITDRKDTEQRLQHALALNAATIESTTDGIIVVDTAARQISRNRRFDEIWNLAKKPLPNPDQAGVLQAMLDQMKDPADFRRLVADTVADPGVDSTASIELLDGRHLEVYSKPQIVDGAVAGRVWSWRDATERRRFEAALLRLANFDPLTQLMNRRKILEEIGRVLAGGAVSRAALLLLDLDGFKEVNDSFGHLAGDQVLVQLSNALKDAELGDLVGRIGGDEFAIFLPNVTRTGAVDAAHRTLSVISSRSFIGGGGVVSLSGSIGVALYPNHGQNGDELLSAADLAMYEAKGAGPSRVQVYSRALRQRSWLLVRGTRQARLKEAIEKRRGRLYAQQLTALRHDLPAVFWLSLRLGEQGRRPISIAEVSSLPGAAAMRLRLDRQLIEEALALSTSMAGSWTAPGLALEISAKSLLERDMLVLLHQLSATHASADGPLLLELSDIEAVAGAPKLVRGLQSAGYQFVAREAGGRSLRRVLEVMPIDYLRLEDGVLGPVKKGRDEETLLRGLVEMARAIGAATIVEAGGDEAVLARLRAAGVAYALTARAANRLPAAALLGVPPAIAA